MSDPVELARAGDLAAIRALSLGEGAAKSGRHVYKWLCAAEDFGHDVRDEIDDLLEVSDLRHDDDGYERCAAHWELASAYLLGDGGLPRDLTRAERHLTRAVQDFSVEQIAAATGEAYDADHLLERVDGEAFELLRRGLAGDPYQAVIRRVQRLRRLRAIESVPEVVLNAEEERLMEAVGALIALPEEEPES